MILFFDTETTGFPHKRQSPLDDCQPHLVQLGLQLVTHDNEIVSQMGILVDCGVESAPGALKAHGITKEKTSKFGVTPATAVDCFNFFMARADFMVAHNAEFDQTIMEIACSRRAGLRVGFGIPFVCTMAAAKDALRLPPTERMVKTGRTGSKNPNLGECMQHMFGEELDGAHDALIDTNACRRAYFWLKERGHVS